MNNLIKFVGIVTIILTSFGGAGQALATYTNHDNETCEVSTNNYFSSDENSQLTVDGNPTAQVATIHPNWTAIIPGAEWVWSEYPIADAQNESTKVFVLSFDIAGTPEDSNLEIATDNSYKVGVNGLEFATDSSENNFQEVDSYIIPASRLNTGENTIVFEVKNWAVTYEGTQASNPAGLLFSLSVNEETCVPPCEPQITPLYARIKMNLNDATKWRNWGVQGDLNKETPIFVGGNNSDLHTNGGNVYDVNEWIPLTNPDGTFINDSDISGYRDVSGLAVQRMDGALRVVLFGGHDSEIIGKELFAGSIELSTDMVNRLTGAWEKPNRFIDPISIDSHNGTRIHDASVNDAQNPMDSRGNFNGYIHQYNPRFDNVRVFANLFQFHLVVSTGSDGFYARYNFDTVAENSCEEMSS